ncbi:MAG: hypothetical protein V3575_06505 [Candidatus Absconditabacteria bacterium]
MKIVICGSMSSSELMAQIGEKLESKSFEVILPKHTKEYASGIMKLENSKESTENKIKDNLIKDYFNKIAQSDAVLIVNVPKNNIPNYIGGNSFLEMAFAHVLDKKIYLLNPIPDMIYTDEIIALRPVVIHGNLDLIV